MTRDEQELVENSDTSGGKRKTESNAERNLSKLLLDTSLGGKNTGKVVNVTREDSR
jgi:hypothetical protein